MSGKHGRRFGERSGGVEAVKRRTLLLALESTVDEVGIGSDRQRGLESDNVLEDGGPR